MEPEVQKAPDESNDSANVRTVFEEHSGASESSNVASRKQVGSVAEILEKIHLRLSRVASTGADLRKTRFEDHALARLGSDLRKQLEVADRELEGSMQECVRRRRAYHQALGSAAAALNVVGED